MASSFPPRPPRPPRRPDPEGLRQQQQQQQRQRPESAGPRPAADGGAVEHGRRSERRDERPRSRGQGGQHGNQHSGQHGRPPERQDDAPRSREHRHGTVPEVPRQPLPEAPRQPLPTPRVQPPAATTAWEQQSGWYDQHQGQDGDDFYQQLILPAMWRRLLLTAGKRVLDVGCGQGVVGRYLAERQVASLGVDASPALVESAARRAGPLERYRTGDATRLDELLGDERFDGATAVLALQDLDPLEPLFAGVAQALKPGAQFVIVLTHPCFRIPKRSGWGFDHALGVQYRRIEAYLSPAKLPIITHPGRPHDSKRTYSFHRPLATYLTLLGVQGFGVTAADELCSHRRGTKGPHFAAEDFCAKEIPLFLVLSATRR